MASRESRRAQRQTAARVREFRRTGIYEKVIPRNATRGARQSRLSYLRELAAKPADQRTRDDRNQLGGAASRGNQGQEGYEEFDTPEFEDYWYHHRGANAA